MSTQFSSIARYFLVNKRTVRIFPMQTSPLTLLCSIITYISLCISLAKNWDLFLKTVTIFSLLFHHVLLTTTNDNFKMSNWFPETPGIQAFQRAQDALKLCLDQECFTHIATNSHIRISLRLTKLINLCFILQHQKLVQRQKLQAIVKQYQRLLAHTILQFAYIK